jgi:hypothetical protein
MQRLLDSPTNKFAQAPARTNGVMWPDVGGVQRGVCSAGPALQVLQSATGQKVAGWAAQSDALLMVVQWRQRAPAGRRANFV